MSDFNTLFNIRSLRQFAKDIEFEELEMMLNKLKHVVIERQEEEDKKRVALAEKEEHINMYIEMLKNDGINIEELVSALTSAAQANKKVKRKPTLAKYQYQDGKGALKTWTGQGRTPKLIQDKLDNGMSLKDFLIPS